MTILEQLLRSGKRVSRGGSAAGGAPGSRALNMTMERQLETNWCWAAVSVSVRKFYTPGSPVTQCQIANQQLSTGTCCANSSSATCNKPWFLNRALAGMGALNAMSNGTLPFTSVQIEIDNTRPLGCRIGWRLGGGHFVCIDGYASVATGDFVTILDPWYGTTTETYSNFSTNYRSSGSWTHSYTTNP